MFSANQKEEIRWFVKHLFQECSTCEGSITAVELKSKFSELMFNVILGMITGKQYHGEKTIDVEEGRRFRQLVQETL